MSLKINTIEEGIAELKAGRMLIVVDSPDRENQGDLIFPAELATTEMVNFLLNHSRGMICTALTSAEAKRLSLPLQVPPIHATEKTKVQFTVTVDSKDVTAFGISSEDRAKTIRTLSDPKSVPTDLVRPGHVFPLLARDGGVVERQGHTEATVDLCRLAGFSPVGVLCEILLPNGEPARLPELIEFGNTHGLKIVSVEDLKTYVEKNPLPKIVTTTVVKEAQAKLPTDYGVFTMYAYTSTIDGKEHLALVMGDIKKGMLTRIHSECVTGDALGSRTCDCGPQLKKAMQTIGEHGSGIILYLNQEGRGIGLVNKVKAYALQQEKGLDTVEANVALGFAVDERNFKIAADILTDLSVSSIRLMTNNPEKMQVLKYAGIVIDEHVPLQITPHETNAGYLKVKKEKLGHILDF